MERIYLQALGVWALFPILAILNAEVRNTVYELP